jgi:hypothetical protein
MTSWVYDEKFSTGTWFLFRTLPFMMGEDNVLLHLVQEQEERRTMMIGFEFPRGIKNSATMCQQPSMTDSINSLARLLIGTTSMTT